MLASVFAGGCQRLSRQAADDDVRIELDKPLFDPAVGTNFLDIRVFDEAGQPVEDAVLHVRGDMTHAGMVPVLADSAESENGLYRVPFEWTIAGDWIVTVEAELSDGRRASRQFEMTVTGDDIYCTVEE